VEGYGYWRAHLHSVNGATGLQLRDKLSSRADMNLLNDLRTCSNNLFRLPTLRVLHASANGEPISHCPIISKANTLGEEITTACSMAVQCNHSGTIPGKHPSMLPKVFAHMRSNPARGSTPNDNMPRRPPKRHSCPGDQQQNPGAQSVRTNTPMPN
jgi:hypothetical protein